jgi:predicted DNA-binding protein
MGNVYSATRTIRIAQEKDQRMLAVCDWLGKTPNWILNVALDRYLEADEADQNLVTGKGLEKFSKSPKKFSQ